MRSVTLTELRTRTGQIIRSVSEEQARILVTNRGKPWAILVPYSPAEEINKEAAWEEFLSLREAIGRTQAEPFCVADLMDELRR